MWFIFMFGSSYSSGWFIDVPEREDKTALQEKHRLRLKIYHGSTSTDVKPRKTSCEVRNLIELLLNFFFKHLSLIGKQRENEILQQLTCSAPDQQHDGSVNLKSGGGSLYVRQIDHLTGILTGPRYQKIFI